MIINYTIVGNMSVYRHDNIHWNIVEIVLHKCIKQWGKYNHKSYYRNQKKFTVFRHYENICKCIL